MARPSAEAIIRLRAVPDSSLNRTLNGTVGMSRKAAREIERDFVKSTKERERAEKQLAVVAAREAKNRERIAAQEARYKQQVAESGTRLQLQMNADRRRDAERQARHEQRLARETERMKQRALEATRREGRRIAAERAREGERDHRQEVRRAQQTARELARLERDSARGFRRGLATAGGAVVGGVLGAANAAGGFSGQAAGALGVNDPSSTMGSAKDITEGLIRSLGQAGFDDAFVKDTISKIDAAAKRNKVGQGELASGLLKAQAKFSDPKFFLENIDFLAQMSRATGSAPEQLVDFALGQRQIGGLTDQQARDLTSAAFVQGGKGSIEFREMAGTFAPSIATFAQDMGASGLEEMMQIQGIVQVLAKSLKNPAEVATTLERFGARLKQKPVQQKLKALGVDIADEQGNIDRSPAEVVQMLAASEKLRASPQTRQKVFSDLLGESAASTLITRLDADPNLLRNLVNVNPQEGVDLAARINAQLDASPFSAVDQMNIEAQSVTLAAGSDLVEAFVTAAEQRMKLATENPVAFEAAGPIAQTVGGLGFGAMLSRWLFGGSGSKAAEAAGTAATAAAAAKPAAAVALAGGAAAALVTAGAQGAASVIDETPMDVGAGSGLEAFGGLFAGLYEMWHGAPIDLSDDTVKRINDANRRDPAKVVIEVKRDGSARVQRIVEGEGLTVDVAKTGNQLMSLP